ncbi:MAG: hypothetical protein JWO52_2387 [Gammaproteobacteria bacterium]|jgi:hypothetical protein|nr:hypothetical protein [Gammaproteobacteria bacterium]
MNGSKSARGDRVKWWEAALMIRGQTEADQHNIRVFTIWCVVWGLGFWAVNFALSSFPGLRGPFAWMLGIIPIVLSVAAVRACLRFLREADEFARKVQVEGIAVGFGAGSVFCIGYFILERLGAPELPIIFAAVPMAFGWAVGALLVAARYR